MNEIIFIQIQDGFSVEMTAIKPSEKKKSL